MARTAKEIPVTEEQRHELLMMSRSQKLDHRYVLRASIILLSIEGEAVDAIMKRVQCSRKAVNKWRNRFREKGMEGLQDMPRPGQAPIYSAEQKAAVIEKACTKPDGGYTNWSQQRIADAVGMSKSHVNRILMEANLKPHKVQYWCGSVRDSEFEAKMTNIVGLYMNPPENAMVICVDEKTQMQALDRTQPELPLKPGSPRRQTATNKRNGTVSLIAALAVHTGEVTAKTMQSNNADNFLSFLKKLNRKYPHKQLHIIADNLSVHKHKDVKAWLEHKRRITLHFTPTYSSWLNQVEIWFNILSKDVIKGGVWKSSEQMANQIMEYIRTYNNTRAKPFQWTYTGKPLTI